MGYLTKEKAQELVRNGLTKELLEPFMERLGKEIETFSINILNSISVKEQEQLIKLLQAQDEYSQDILNDLTKKFFESNNGIENRILDDLLLEQKIQKLFTK